MTTPLLDLHCHFPMHTKFPPRFTKSPPPLGKELEFWAANMLLNFQGGKPRAIDGPYSETKEVLGGYYTIEAANYEEAVQRSLDHPHLEYGGTIELRQVYGS